jgi:hypothetical protein
LKKHRLVSSEPDRGKKTEWQKTASKQWTINQTIMILASLSNFLAIKMSASTYRLRFFHQKAYAFGPALWNAEALTPRA